MIPTMNIIAWGNKVPWAAQRQVEQDLIISRALVEMFTDPVLSRQLRMRGGTVLNKLHFSQPYRYSEDKGSGNPHVLSGKIGIDHFPRHGAGTNVCEACGARFSYGYATIGVIRPR